MSYCVHCGVELDASLKRCPLCDTPVLDPHNIPTEEAISPYPSRKGKVDEPVRRKDIAIIYTIFLITVSVTCGLLNLFVFSKAPWSLIVLGICLLLWVFSIPFIIYHKISPYLAIILDGGVVILFLYMLAILIGRFDWFYSLALPIPLLFTFLWVCTMLLHQKVSHSFSALGLYILSDISIFCIGIELLCRHYAEKLYRITWSAVVLTVCAILSILIISLFFIPRLREAARRRLHF